MQVFPDGGTSSILPSIGGLVAVTANAPGTFFSQGNPVALFTVSDFTPKFVTGGAPGCQDTVAGEDGGVGFIRGNALAADVQDNVYVADWSATQSGCTRIRKVAYDGTTSTLAGTGAAGYKDGPGSIAQFYEPSGIAVDKNLNLYISSTVFLYAAP